MVSNDVVVLITYFAVLVAVVITFMDKIHVMIGGFTKCYICTKVHFNGYITNWSITHFIAFLVAGLISPKSVYYIIVAGIVWEVFELYLEYTSKRNHSSILCKNNIIDCTKQMSDTEFWNHYLGIKEHEYTQIWCSGGLLGSVFDIIINTLGVYSGIYLRTLLFK